MPLSRYLKVFPCPDRADSFIVYSTKKGSIIRLSSDLLAAAREDRLSEPDRLTLARLQIVVDDQGTEKEEMRGILEKSDRKNRFSALVVLNLDCNLACPYCYEDPFRGKHYMSQETAGQLVETVTRDHILQGRDVSLDFYGGEALLSKALLIEIARSIRTEAEKAGVKFRFGMVTNGTLLTRATVTELTPLGFTAACVTLDGPKEVHDRQRPFVSGLGSFDTIVKNLKSVHDLCLIELGGNYTPDNYRLYPALLDYLLREGLSPDKLGTIHFSPIIPKATSVKSRYAAGCSSSAEDWIREASVFLREETMKRGFTVQKATMTACMVDLPGQLVVNYDGTLFKCPALMGWPELSIGTLSEGIRDYTDSHGLNIWKNEECLDCPYLPICFGGCRFLTLLRNGAINAVDCRKDFYDATLEQVVRQNLLHGGK